MADGQSDETSTKRALTDGPGVSGPVGARSTVAAVGRAVGGTRTLDSVVGLDTGSPRGESARPVAGVVEPGVVATDSRALQTPTASGTTSISSR